jgi:hypothetical protein
MENGYIEYLQNFQELCEADENTYSPEKQVLYHWSSGYMFYVGLL